MIFAVMRRTKEDPNELRKIIQWIEEAEDVVIGGVWGKCAACGVLF